MPMHSLTPTTSAEYLSALTLGGFILEDVTLRRPEGDVVAAVTIRAVRLLGSREGLAVSLEEGGVFVLWHVPSGVRLWSRALRGMSVLTSALGRTLYFAADWTVARPSDFSPECLASLRELRAYFD